MANRQLLARATEGTSAPTPGYLYNDLSQAAQSSPTAASEMVDYLVHRLQSTHNVHTKAKCLTVVSKLCDSSLSFKRTLAQKPPCVQAIKDGLRHAGPPDPVCGDAYHQKVRAAAQAAVDAVYRADPAPATLGGGTVAPHYASPPGSSMGMTSSRPRMEGLGNPRYKDPRLEPAPPSTIQEVAREAGDVILGMIKDPLARNHHVGRHGNLPGSNKYATGHHGGYGPSSHGRVGELYSGSQGGYSASSSANRFGPPPGAAQLAQQTGGQWTMASNRGPNAVVGRTEREQDHYYPQQSAGGATYRTQHGGVGGSWGAAGHSTPSITIQATGGHASQGVATAVTAPASDGTYEKNLILELCPPGGMKAVPPPDKLAAFAKMLPSLNADLVCPVLLDCLEEGQPWIVRAKALCVMETCLRSGNVLSPADGSSQNPYRDFFHACQGEILPLTNHPRAQIKDPAKRVVAIMGGAPEGFHAAEQAAAPVAAPPVVNLLDFDDDVPAAPAPNSAPPPAPSGGDMFGGMMVKAKGDTSSATQTAPTTAQGAAATPEPSLLDLVNDTAAPTPASAPNKTNDIFRDMGVKETQNATNMFQNLSLAGRSSGGEDKKSDSEDAGDLHTMSAATAGSAFGFINQTSTKEEQQSKPNFDPLTAPPTSPTAAAKNMMPMMQSPEQMQAMAYQQMLMQQRMQMQMALAMQQQQGGVAMPFAVGMGSPSAMMAPNMTMMNTAGASNTFAKPVKTDDHKFDFVKDAMKTQVKK